LDSEWQDVHVRGGRLLIVIGFGLAAAAVLALVALGVGRGEPVDSLPDLDQAAPGELSGRTAGTTAKPRFFLGFESAAGNLGDGPLIVLGSRPSTGVRTMRVTQEIHRTDGTTRSVGVSTRLRYVRSPDHSHWHLLGFMRYELRRADGSLVRPDRKTGFCLGNRYEIRPPLEGEPKPHFECGKNKPSALGVREGISVGYGDDYDAHLEGQEFEITGLPAGRYLLVHRVNSSRLLIERDYRNNAASMALELSWPRGTKKPPSIDVVERCPGTATCP
jgi:hypothetical protein